MIRGEGGGGVGEWFLPKRAGKSSVKRMTYDPGSLGSSPGTTPCYPCDLGQVLQPVSFLICKRGMILTTPT